MSRQHRLLRQAGFALATTFMVGFLVLLAGFTMATVASFNYSLARQSQLRDEAFDAANAGVSLAIDQLIQSPDWGSAQASRTTDVLPQTHVTGAAATPSDPQSFYLTFDPTTPHSGYPTGLPWSVNNLNGARPMNGPIDPANGVPHQVPPGSALIFVEGLAGAGSQWQARVLEVLLQSPSYPYAMAASQAIISYSGGSCGAGWIICPCSATLVDGCKATEKGSILVRPMPGAQPWKGGYTGGAPAPPCGPAPYAVFMPHGSVVTGRIVTAGKTNFNAVCSPNPCNYYNHLCTKPQAHQIVCICPSSSPLPCETLPDLRPLLGPTLAVYTNPATYPSVAPSSAAFSTDNHGCVGPPQSVTVYSNGGLIDTSCALQVNGDTLIVAPSASPLGNREPILILGAKAKPLEFTGEYTLTVQNAFVNIPGGIVGSASNFVNATLVILPLSVNAPMAPNWNEYSEIRVRHNYHGSSGKCGLGSACSSNVSIFSMGNLVVGDPCRHACTSCGCCCTKPWEMDGLFASLGGDLTFFYHNVRVKGILMAEDPWQCVQCCHGVNWGNFGTIYLGGNHVSYAPTMARQASVGAAVAGAATQNGLQVVFWRDIQPGL